MKLLDVAFAVQWVWFSPSVYQSELRLC